MRDESDGFALIRLSWILIAALLIGVNCMAEPVSLDDQGLCVTYLEVEICNAKLQRQELDPITFEFRECQRHVIRANFYSRLLWNLCFDKDAASAFENMFGLHRLDYYNSKIETGGRKPYDFILKKGGMIENF